MKLTGKFHFPTCDWQIWVDNMNKHIGGNFDDFLVEEGTLAETETIAIKRAVAYQITQFMKKKCLSKSAMARQMNTSRSTLDRLLVRDGVKLS